ncbi:hypothetical protein LEP1GSC193_3507 [Leptospira alstonii serovar Pingchang str. 80-412]|uniref:Uncharacterized protein n=2 Tax=Leptospira alstonii TaxID=28452 RepID=M6CHU9_9LEPT|nr:hypothetical protein LEP1GSC194_2309 [Leptospira alstonii serovar Sichuan str. 79601]EQA81991.1 hypothetical protein LEP1GSC193_3507 [Leptospira alstonii serovar Pingchang str. 80-412]
MKISRVRKFKKLFYAASSKVLKTKSKKKSGTFNTTLE